MAGLKSTPVVDMNYSCAKQSNEFVRWGATIGPFLMGLITGSGDAESLPPLTQPSPACLQNWLHP